MVASYCREFKYDGLLHDAHEAYIGDISQPFKNYMEEEGFYFHGMEEDIGEYVRENLGAHIGIPDEVEAWDKWIGLIELDYFFNYRPENVTKYLYDLRSPYKDIVNMLQLRPREIEKLFLEHYFEYKEMSNVQIA